jgi:hypothetical protein
MALAHNALTIAATQGIFLALAWIFVLARLYVRKFMVHGVALDDYFLLLTVVSSPLKPQNQNAETVQCLYTIFAAMISVVASIYVFNHPTSIEAYYAALIQVARGVHYFFLAEVFYTTTAACLRVTVGLLLLRIAHTRAQKITIYVTMILMVIISTAFLCLVIFQCTPVGYYWDYTPGAKGSCHIEKAVLPDAAYMYAAVSFISDWILGLMPIWLLWSIQISRNKKIGVGFMLSLGLLCGVAAITRTVYIGRLDAANFEANWIGLALCSVIEPGLGIIAASIAAFRPIFATQWFKSLSSKSSSARNTAKQWTIGSGPNLGKKEKEKTFDTGLTGTTLGQTQKDGSGSGDGNLDEEHGITVTYAVERRECVL